MKKLLSLIFALMFMTTTVLADSLAFLETPMTSYEAEMSFSLKLNKPLDFIGVFTEENDELAFFNPQLFFESLGDMTANAVIKSDMSSDYKKGLLSYELESDIPLRFNRNLKLSADTRMGMWVDFDFGDKTEYTYVMRNPMSDKYMFFDLVDLMYQTDEENAEKQLSLFNDLFDKGFMESVMKATKKSLVENSDMKKSGRTYTFTLSDKGIKQLYADIFGEVSSIYAKAMPEEEWNQLVEIGEEVKTALNAVNLFGDDGVKFIYTLDYSGKISSAETDININTNIYDMLSLLTGAGTVLTRDMCDIDFSINMKADYKNVGKSIKVEAPVLTEKNSVNMNEMLRAQQEAMPDYSDYDSGYVTIETDSYMEYENGEIALPVRDVLNAFGVSNENIAYDNGVITVNTENGTAELTVGSDKLYINGEEFVMNTPVAEENSRAMADTSFIGYMFNFEMLYGTYDITSDTVICECGEIYEYEEIVPDFDEVDYFSTYSQKYIETDGKLYLPVRDVLYGFYINDENITVDGNTVTVTAEKPFKKLVFEIGSDKISVDGREYTLEGAVFEEGDRAYVEESFTKYAFGAVIESCTYDFEYKEVYCDFIKESALALPEYTEL